MFERHKGKTLNPKRISTCIQACVFEHAIFIYVISVSTIFIYVLSVSIIRSHNGDKTLSEHESSPVQLVKQETYLKDTAGRGCLFVMTLPAISSSQLDDLYSQVESALIIALASTGHVLVMLTSLSSSPPPPVPDAPCSPAPKTLIPRKSCWTFVNCSMYMLNIFDI